MRVEDHVRVEPHHFGLPTREAIEKQLNQDFVDTITKEFGYVIAVLSVGDIEDGVIIPGDGSAFYKSQFELIVWKPELHELVYTTISEVTTFGAFIEIGSAKAQWNDKEAGKIIAGTIIESLKTFKKKPYKTAIGIGGPHYCPSFNKIQLEENFAISHLVPEYSLPINEEIIKQLIEKTIPKPEYFILDWKGIGKSDEKDEFISLLKKFNLEIIKTKDAKIN